MGYVTNNYRKDRVVKYGYPPSCVPIGITGTGFVTPELVENVTSYRGKMEWIQVGSDRRKVFHSFDRLFYEMPTEPSTFCWSPQGAPGHHLYGYDIQVSRYRSRWDAHVNPSVNSLCEQSKWPIAGTAFHHEVAEKYRDEVIANLFVKLNEPRWNGAVFFAELLETLVSIKVLLRGCIEAFTKTSKAWRTVKHLTLNSEELWLWYRYFLMPAILDATDLLEAIKPQVKIDRCQAGKSKIKYTNSGEIISDPYWFAPHNVSLVLPWKQDVKIGAGCAMDILNRFDPNEWGFGSADLLRAGWEIVPFSFIFDWFVNLGDFLTTIRDVEIEQAQSYATYAIETDLTFYTGYDCFQDIDPVIHHFQMNRIIDLEPPTSPMVNNQWMNILRTVDSIALAAGILKGILSGRRRH